MGRKAGASNRVFDLHELASRKLDWAHIEADSFAMKTAKNKASRRKVSKASPRAKPPVKCPDFYKELKEIFGNRSFEKELARYNEAIS